LRQRRDAFLGTVGTSWTFEIPFAKKAAVQGAAFASDEQERGRKVENQAREFASGHGEVVLHCAFWCGRGEEKSRDYYPNPAEERGPRQINVAQEHRILVKRDGLKKRLDRNVTH
jgi:hypothetical protein